MKKNNRQKSTAPKVSSKELDTFIREATEKLEKKIKELENAKAGLEEQAKQRTKELEDKVKELEKFRSFAVGREIKMIELKKEIERLKEKLESD